MKPSEALLVTQSVTASRPAEDSRPRTVLNETTLGVDAGELLAIVGPSGSGKSTFLRLLNRLLEPDSGTIFLEGQDVRTVEPPLLRAQLPLVAQKPYLFSGSVKDNLFASSRLRRAQPPDISGDSFKKLLAMCQLETDWLGRDARKLSIGQQQRVCLMRAILGPCKVLLLDEPTSALDRPTADQLALTFRQLCEDKSLAIIFVTHDLRVAERCADRVALMQAGSVIECGSTEEVLSNPKTEAARNFLSLDTAEKQEQLNE